MSQDTKSDGRIKNEKMDLLKLTMDFIQSGPQDRALFAATCIQYLRDRKHMLHHHEGQDLMKMCNDAIYDTKWWDTLHDPRPIEEQRWAEKRINEFNVDGIKTW